jgi:hypothetical protein
MKLAIIALASAFVLSSTFALATTSHHHKSKGVKTHQGTVGMSRSMNRYNQGTVGMGRSMNYGGPGYGARPGYGGGPNNLGGLVGGSDSGTFRP